jgi:hypothetical protein
MKDLIVPNFHKMQRKRLDFLDPSELGKGKRREEKKRKKEDDF